MCRVFATTVLLAGIATTVSAQSSVGIGYDFLRLSVAGDSSNLPYGVGFDYTHTVRKSRFDALGVFDWARRQDSVAADGFAIGTRAGQLAIAGGVRASLGGPYVQTVAGLARSSFRATFNGLPGIDDSSNDFMVEPGIGYGQSVAGRLDVFGQVNYRKVWPHADSLIFFNETVQGLRVFGGARVRVRR